MDCSGIVVFDLKGNPIHITHIQTKAKETHGERLKYIADKIQGS